VDQISATTTEDAAQTPQEGQPAGAAPHTSEPVGFRSRGSARRRARFLRKARELGYRDLGGLVFNLHRFGQRNDALVLAKLTTLGHIDTELRALEGMLGETRPVTVLREAGITACPRCAAIHSSQDHFCPNCGFTMRRHADLPIAAPAPTSVPVQTGAPATGQAPTPAPVPAHTLDSAPVRPQEPSQTPPPVRSDEEDGPTEIISPPVPGS
jgi:hypothetical protein